MRFLQSAIAVWLLAAFGACYAFPVTVAYSARATNCCHGRAHGSGCRRSENAGSAWTAATECAQGCRLPAGVAVYAAPLVAPGLAATYVTVRSETLGPADVNPAGFASYFAFLYQRPPPFGF